MPNDSLAKVKENECVCVCVRERERERERSLCFLSSYPTDVSDMDYFHHHKYGLVRINARFSCW